MGNGIAHGGAVRAKAETLKLSNEPEGEVLLSLLDGEVVDERTSGGRGVPDVDIALLQEATPDHWGILYVGRTSVHLAPLEPHQLQQRVDMHGLRGVDNRPLKELMQLREQRAGKSTWELRNVLIDQIEARDTRVVKLD